MSRKMNRILIMATLSFASSLRVLVGLLELHRRTSLTLSREPLI